MTITINKSDRGSSLRGQIRPPKRGDFRRRRDHKFRLSEEIRTRSIAYDLGGVIEEKPKTASSVAPFLSGAKVIVPVLFALVPLSVAFGATATGNGLSALQTLAMSVFVLAGAAQLTASQLIGTGASVAVIVLTVLVINLRLALYSASMAPHFRRLSAGWKGLLSYLLTDPAYAATINRFDGGKTKEPDRRWYFLGAALAVWITWQAGTMMGFFLGAWVPEGWSLDFVSPLIFIALFLPAIKDRATVAAALSAGVAAVFAAALPLNLGLITAALVGILGGLAAEGVTERRRG